MDRNDRAPPALLAVICSCLLSLAGMAQRTIIVDAAGGGDFTDIQSAVDAAGPFDTIRILHGEYAGATITKSVRILGEPWTDEPVGPGLRVALDSPLAVVSLPAKDSVVISGLRSTAIAGSHFYPTIIQATDCLGSVHVAYVQFGSAEILTCEYVTIDRWTLGNLVLRDSRVSGTDSFWLSASGPAISAVNSELTLVDSRTFVTPGQGSQGIRLSDSSTLRYTADTSIGGSLGVSIPAIQSTNSTVAVQEANSIILDTQFENRMVVQLLEPENATLLALVAGSPTRPANLPEGELFVDPRSVFFLYFGPADPGLLVRRPFFLPPSLTPSRHFDTSGVQSLFVAPPGARLWGVPVTFQGTAFVKGRIELSLPYTVIL